MSRSAQVCPNDECKGTEFTQVRGNLWKCVNCGTKITLGKNRPHKKKISTRPKKKIPKINYKPLLLVCESCGTKIAVIEHPKDEKNFNETWKTHNCREKTMDKRDLLNIVEMKEDLEEILEFRLLLLQRGIVEVGTLSSFMNIPIFLNTENKYN